MFFKRNKQATIKDIILTSDLDQRQLIFSRPDTASEKGYREVLLKGAVSGGALGKLGGQIGLASLAKQFPNGLFTATVNPALLSHFAQGTCSTMVRDGAGQLVAHTGFAAVNAASVNPMIMSLQIVSAAAEIYYTQELFNQLEAIAKGIDKLISLHHDEKLSQLIQANKRVRQILQHEQADGYDILELRELRQSVETVFEEYKIQIDRQQSRLIRFKPKAWLVNDKVSEYRKELSELHFYMTVCYEADVLSVKMLLSEIVLRKQMNIVDPVLQSLYKELEQRLDDSFSIHFEREMTALSAPLLERAKRFIGDGKVLGVIDLDRDRLFEKIIKDQDSFRQSIGDTNHLQMVQKVLQDRYTEQEMLVLVDDNQGIERVFIATEDNEN